MNGRRKFLSLLSLALIGPVPAMAQGTQVAEDAEVGVRLAIPKAWEWRKRDSNPRPSLFINCMPEVTKTYPCWLLVEYFTAPPNQAAITDADRQKWESWYSASGMRKIVSRRDLKVGGLPAYEIIGNEGQGPGAARSSNTFVLAPTAGRVFRLTYIANHDGKESYDRYRPAIDAALQSFALAAKSAAGPRGK